MELNYKDLYYKYKYKYKQLLKNTIQKGGANISNFDNTLEIYNKLPESGLYDNNLSDIDRIKKFTKFCNYFIEKTKDYEDVILSKKKQSLEQKKLTNTKEYMLIVETLADKGREYQKIGNDFEMKVFRQLLSIIIKILKLENSKLNVLHNPTLYFKDSNNDWLLIGETDSVVITAHDGINYIVAICEMKHNFDDIPDALFQIKRSFNVLKNKGMNNVKLDNLILDEKYQLLDDSTYLNMGFIFTSEFDTKSEYFNVQSKLRHYLLNILHINYKVKYEKIFEKLKNKQVQYDRVLNTKILRYSSGVIETLKLYQSNNLIDRIQVI